MAQFHYVVFYDTDTQKWGVESDTAAHFPDGNIYDAVLGNFWDAWSKPSDPTEAALDDSLVRLLGYLVDTWPAPGVVANA